MDIFQGAGTPLSTNGLNDVVTKLGGNAASLWSVLSVETRGFGFLADRRPQILFERHIFHQRTHGRFSASNPDISSSSPGGYASGAGEYPRLKRAMLLDETAALESASWGLGQVMGFHAARLEYRDVHDMVDRFRDSEDAQLDGCARFIAKAPPLHDAFQQRKWDRFAYFYNGKNYAINRYDKKLAASYQVYSNALPDIDVRAVQARLTYLGYQPGPIDGDRGGPTSRTNMAIAKFCAARKIAPPASNASLADVVAELDRAGA